MNKIFVDCRSTALIYNVGQNFQGLNFRGCYKIHEIHKIFTLKNLGYTVRGENNFQK